MILPFMYYYGQKDDKSPPKQVYTKRVRLSNGTPALAGRTYLTVVHRWKGLDPHRVQVVGDKAVVGVVNEDIGEEDEGVGGEAARVVQVERGLS